MVMFQGTPSTKAHMALGVKPRDLGDPGDTGNILTPQSGFINLVTGGAEVRTMDDPQFEGQVIDLFFETDGGNCVITCDSAINQNGDTIMTFSDIGEHIQLIGGRAGGGAREWRVVANDGVVLS